MKRVQFLYWLWSNCSSKMILMVMSAFVSVLLTSSHLQAQVIVVSGNKTITVTTAVIGSEPTPVITNSTLSYKRRAKIAKITVGTSCPGQNFTLKVLAVSPTAGTAAPEVTLTDGMLAVNFIINIPSGSTTTWRTASLRYTASSTFAQGNSAELGNDVHTVTYTLVVQ
ncbi:MAG: hypothetical protein HY276_11770 [Ignavibacteriales bacterium]|nr:hypothetical protein [Ignavibacteriales bacterium]